jgi:uncharacterized protein involved in outer membrane biogenesis
MSRRSAVLVLATAALLLVVYALAGFVLLPYLVERHAPRLVGERTDAELRLGDTEFNPFLLRFEARDLHLVREPGQRPLLAIERLSVDLDWASLWTRTWTVSALELRGLAAEVEIDANGDLNWAVSMAGPQGGGSGGEQNRDPEPLPRLLVKHAVIDDATVTLADLRGATPARVVLGSVEIAAFDVATFIRDRDPAGRYQFDAALAEGGAISARGSIELAPAARSSGQLQLVDLNLPAIWPLLRGGFGLDLAPVAATFAASTQYVAAVAGPAPAVELVDAQFRFGGVTVQTGAGAKPLLRLESLSGSGGRFDLAGRNLTFAEVSLVQGALAANVDGEGRLDWQAIGSAPSRQSAAAAPPAPSREQPAPARGPGVRWHGRIDALRIDDIALRAVDRSRALPLALEIGAIDGRTAVTFELDAGPPRIGFGGLEARLDGLRLTAADNGAPASGAPLLAFDTLAVTGATLDSRERRIEIEQVAARGGRVEVQLAQSGPSGLLQALRPRRAEPADGSDAAAPWDYAVDTVSAEGVELALRHGDYEPAIQYRAELARATVRNLASAAPTPMQFEARLGLNDGGTLQATGTLAQSGASFDGELRFERLPLLPLQPLLARHARLELRSGLLSGQARVAMGPGHPGALNVTGSARVQSVRIDEAGTRDRFLSWKTLAANGIDFNTAPRRLAIAEIALEEPGAKFIIGADRSVNLTQVVRVDAAAAGNRAPTAPDGPPLEVAIERVAIEQGTVDFADLSLVLPFSTQVTRLEGSVVDITTRAGERARIEATGEIGTFGAARVQGSLLPFTPRQFLDLAVAMDNVAIPPLSPYTATFAGRTVAEGKLWLNLEYQIENGKLLGKNHIRLADFRLGERVEAPNALDLPLDLAVALLRDDRGVIELAVPVSGDVGGPSFAIAPLVTEAIGNLLKRIVSAPFRALGRLFGDGEGDGEKRARIEFAAGSDELLAPQREKLEEVAQAIARRPQLRLVVSGPYAPERDADALRRREVRRELARMLGEEVAPGDNPGLVAYDSEATRRALETLLVKHAGQKAVEEARSEPAPYPAMFERIVRNYPLPDSALKVLASRRAEAIRDYLVGGAGAPADRVRTGRLEAIPGGGDRPVATTLGLDAVSSPPQPAAAGSGR